MGVELELLAPIRVGTVDTIYELHRPHGIVGGAHRNGLVLRDRVRELGDLVAPGVVAVVTRPLLARIATTLAKAGDLKGAIHAVGSISSGAEGDISKAMTLEEIAKIRLEGGDLDGALRELGQHFL